MYKNKYIKIAIFSILLIAIVSLFISASSAMMVEHTNTVDSGNNIIKVNNEKYKINWHTEEVTGNNGMYVAHVKGETEKSTDNNRRYVYISYKSMKNKKNNGYLHIKLEKTSKNKIRIGKSFSQMIFSTDKVVKMKTNVSNYYLKRIKPNMAKLTKNAILNNQIIKYNITRYLNKTEIDSSTNETIVRQYRMNWLVYHYKKTSLIEIKEKYIDLTALNETGGYLPHTGYDQNIRIEKYTKGKLKITRFAYLAHVMKCGPSGTTSYKYPKTNLSPKQYYVQVYKQILETKVLS